MQLAWTSFADEVRDIASRVYGFDCEEDVLHSVRLDGLSKLSPDYIIGIRCTNDVSRKLILSAVAEMAALKVKAAQAGLYLKSFVVTRGNAAADIVDMAELKGVTVASVSSFAAMLIEYDKYREARLRHAFGSAVDPQTGLVDTIAYVPVSYKSAGSQRTFTTTQLAEQIKLGKVVILLGEYGSGKSRCIAEVFKHLSSEWGVSLRFPFAINLRECWGMQTSEELVRRHLSTINLSELETSSVRVLRRRSGYYLLDGFDEMGAQAWSADELKLKALRASALKGVRDVVRVSEGGCLIAGREHYFSSFDEMIDALGVKDRDYLIVHAHDEFTPDEMEEYFEAAEINVSLPQWLPRRPLVCQTISQLDSDDISRMFSEQSHEAEFWEYFISVVCKRDARISESFDPDIIMSVYVELARKSRNKPMGVGPFTLRDLQEAFEAAVGQAPTEDASVMLQRLPSLGRVGPESVDRQFVDMYILDGLRARDVGRLPDVIEEQRIKALSDPWVNPLDVLGQRVLARALEQRPSVYRAVMKRAAESSNAILAADLISAFLHTSVTEIDYGGLEITGATFGNLNMSLARVRNLSILNSIIEQFILPSETPAGVKIRNSSAGSVAGASDLAGLPGWARFDTVDEFDSVQTVAKIKTAGLSQAHEIMVAVVKKTFFQKGTGRKEDALLRGFGTGSSPKTAAKILNLLVRYGVLTTFKGDEGTVYAPVRAQAGRMTDMLSQLRTSTDEIWKLVDKMEGV